MPNIYFSFFVLLLSAQTLEHLLAPDPRVHSPSRPSFWLLRLALPPFVGPWLTASMMVSPNVVRYLCDRKRGSARDVFVFLSAAIGLITLSIAWLSGCAWLAFIVGGADFCSHRASHLLYKRYRDPYYVVYFSLRS